MRIAAFIAALLVAGLPVAAFSADAVKTAKSGAARKATVAQKAADAQHAALVAAATRGEEEAQHQLGLAYLGGHGVKADAAMALTWFTLAGANGSVPAAIEAAKAFEAGTGTARNLASAAGWWFRAAQLGDAAARTRWTELFTAGEAPSIGGLVGAGWIAELAGRGDLKAVMALADAYEHGLGIGVNLTEAEAWYRVAATQHADLEARARLGRILIGLPAAWRIPSTEEWNLKDAERKSHPFGAVWFMSKPVGDEDKLVQLRPGILEGERWLSLAANQGHADAQYALGKALIGGVDLPMDIPMGVGWLEAAASRGHGEAMVALGDLADKGLGFFGKDPVRAYVMYDLASTQGEESAAKARDTVAKSLSAKQAARARQLLQDFREALGG
ncbi:TPR repeat-containing protein [Candidatus Terasakiella magnetica]|nr:TPR repeat-containing protein [Candidatus Terasakiella magnetica]